MTYPILALWAAPRTVSTAFERMMIERGDHLVFDEPFSRSYYFGPDRRSRRFDKILPRSSAPEILDDILEAAEEQPVFFKDMAYQALTILDAGFLGLLTNTFLVRDPRYALSSFARHWDDITSEETGYAALTVAHDLAVANGERPVVIDSDDLLADPASLVGAWCRHVGIEERPDALTWRPGMQPQWELWPDWYGSVAESSGFRPSAPVSPPPELPPYLERLHDHCRPHYERLRSLRLRSRADTATEELASSPPGGEDGETEPGYQKRQTNPRTPYGPDTGPAPQISRPEAFQ